MTHYTSAESASMILDRGVILPSRDVATDAAYGPGTYLTAKNPSVGRRELLRNNYDGMGPAQDLMSRTEVGITFKRSELPNAQRVSGGARDIWLVPGSLPLAGKNVEVKPVTKK